MSVEDVVRWGTAGGAEVLGLDATGSLDVGKAADFSVYGLDRERLAAIAARIGPTVEEVATPYTPPDDEVVGLYAFRTGPGIFV